MSLVSIITVCFNSEKHLEQTIQSVLAQTYAPIEYILIDGQSKDRTLDIIKTYAERHSDRIRYVSEPDRGIYEAMNKGLRLATGELIGLINSDDWYEPTAVEAVVRAYEAGGPAVYHGIQRTYRNGEVVGLQCTQANQLRKRMIEHPTCFVPRRFYEEHGFFNEAYQYVGDYELMLRLHQHGVPFIALEQVLANFREGGASHRPEAVRETNRLWLRMGWLSKPEFTYRLVMDRLRQVVGRAHPA